MAAKHQEMRTQHMRELRYQYRGCSLHTLDVAAKSPDRVTVKVKRGEVSEEGTG